MVEATKVRAQISQIEKYNAAVNTFRTKYNGIPGDIQNPLNFGLFSTGMDGSTGHGDGNGFIRSPNQSSGGAPALDALTKGEILVFWRHLSDAQLVDGNFGQSMASGGAVPSNQSAGENNLWLPDAKIGNAASIAVYSDNMANYFQSYVFVDGLPTSGSYGGGPSSLTPIEAQAIDSKMDDGAPNSGLVQERQNGAGWLGGTANSPPNTCAISVTQYDTASSNKNLLTCHISFRFN